LQIAFDDQELSAIGDPGLMPRFARGIVNTKALAFAAVDALVVLVNNAAFENATDPDAGVFCGRDDVKGVPIADPEVEFVIFRGAAGSRCF